MDKGTYLPPSEVPESVIDDYAKQLCRYLNGLVPHDFQTFGGRVSGIVDGMVPPAARDMYRTPDSVIGLAAFEVGNVGQKIRRYQFIERYKFFVDLPDAEMGIAFGEHIYAVRNAELYSILEKGEAIVRFVATLSMELEAGDAKAPSKYAKDYRSQFAYRLRERHRMTHAHERPSVVSRMLQLRELKTDQERRMIKRIFGDMLSTIMETFELIQEKQPEKAPFPCDPATFQNWYLRRVDEEAASMWRIFSKAVSEASGLSDHHPE